MSESSTTDRYDRMAGGYERWWAPVLAPSARRLLDLLADDLGVDGHRVLDVGVGTGNLTRPALGRWPGLRVTGIDASGEMVGTASALIEDELPDARDRFDGRTADAGDLPFEDATFDAAMSSFVLQLVRKRAAVLREVRRVLRPGGRFGHVTWLEDRAPFAPDRVFDQLLDEAGYDEEAAEARHGDIPSADVAAGELRRAGFKDVTVEPSMLEHAFTVDSYIGFLTEFDEETLFDEMGRSERHRFLARLRERLMALPADDLVFRAPIVFAIGRRSR